MKIELEIIVKMENYLKSSFKFSLGCGFVFLCQNSQVKKPKFVLRK